MSWKYSWRDGTSADRGPEAVVLTRRTIPRTRDAGRPEDEVRAATLVHRVDANHAGLADDALAVAKRQLHTVLTWLETEGKDTVAVRRRSLPFAGIDVDRFDGAALDE